jgi:predicted HicB family RNase H-like nuclease
MSDNPKTTYKGNTDAHRRGNMRYLRESVETLHIRVPKGQGAIIKAHAAKHGESMNGFVRRAIDEAMERDS